MKVTKKSKITAAYDRDWYFGKDEADSEYEYLKNNYRRAKRAYEEHGEEDNNDVLTRKDKMHIARGQLNDYARKHNIESAAHDDWYFGKEEADQFGDLIVKKLAGKTVSKRRDKAEEPGGLIFEADRLGIDMWDLLRALEGMCYDGRAREIDDSTYKVVGDLEDSENVYSGSSPFMLLEEIFSADDGDIVDNFLKDACEALGCTTKEWDYKNYLGETETHVLLVDRKGKTIGMLDLHYPEDIIKIYEENDHDYDATSEKVMQYLKDEINMFSEAYDDNIVTI